jgi:hypothetical protein
MRGSVLSSTTRSQKIVRMPLDKSELLWYDESCGEIERGSHTRGRKMMAEKMIGEKSHLKKRTQFRCNDNSGACHVSLDSRLSGTR